MLFVRVQFEQFSYDMVRKKWTRAISAEGVKNSDEPCRWQWVQFDDKRILAHYQSLYPKNIASAECIYMCKFCLIALENNIKYEMHMVCCKDFSLLTRLIPAHFC